MQPQKRKYSNELEKKVYLKLLEYYEEHEIEYNKRIHLTKWPAELFYYLDYDLPDISVEVKGGWIFKRAQEIQFLKVKTYFFLQIPRKKFFVLVGDSKRLKFKNVAIVDVCKLDLFLSNYRFWYKKFYSSELDKLSWEERYLSFIKFFHSLEGLK